MPGFRASESAAPLKHGDARVYGYARVYGFPRFRKRGPIEATPTAPAVILCIVSFRASESAAPLKQREIALYIQISSRVSALPKARPH